jgi:outer membrane protein assembly factor BamB
VVIGYSISHGAGLVSAVGMCAVLGFSQAGIPDGAPTEGNQADEPSQVWHVGGVGRGLPAADSTTAYFLTKQHEVVAVDAATGTLRWKQSTGESSEATWGSRLLLTGLVVVAGDYDVTAFDRTTGAPRWRFSPVDGYGPGIYLGSAAGGRVFTGSPAGRAYAIDQTSGEMHWSALIEADGKSTVFQPAAERDLVVAGYTTFTAPNIGGVVALEASTGRERWRTRFPRPEGVSLGSAWAGGPLLVDGLVIAASSRGEVFAFDRDDGSIRWSVPPVGATCIGELEPPRQDFRSLAYSRGTLFIGSLTGCLEAYDLDTRYMRWRRMAADEGSIALIASDEETVYVPFVGGRFLALTGSTGALRWQMDGRRGFGWPPTIVGDRVYVASSISGFYAFRRPRAK